MPAQLTPEDVTILKLLVVMNNRVLRGALDGKEITVRRPAGIEEYAVTGRIFNTSFANGRNTIGTVMRITWYTPQEKEQWEYFSVRNLIRPGAIDINLDDVPDTVIDHVDPRVLKLLRLMYGCHDQRDSLKNVQVLFYDNPGHINGVRKAPRSEEMTIEITYRDDHIDWDKPLMIADLLQPGALVPLVDHLPDPATQPRKLIVGLEIPVQAET